MEYSEKAPKISLVEQKKREAFADVCDAIDARLSRELSAQFETHGKAYELTSPEDCMVAHAQQMLEEIKGLYDEVIQQNDYRREQAVVKILRLFEMYEKMIALYAELRSYYPVTASRVEAHISPLNESYNRAAHIWEQLQSHK